MSKPTPEQRLAGIGVTLPTVPIPMANYVPYRWAGNLLFLSGQGRSVPTAALKSVAWERTRLSRTAIAPPA